MDPFATQTQSMMRSAYVDSWTDNQSENSPLRSNAEIPDAQSQVITTWFRQPLTRPTSHTQTHMSSLAGPQLSHRLLPPSSANEGSAQAPEASPNPSGWDQAFVGLTSSANTALATAAGIVNTPINETVDATGNAPWHVPQDLQVINSSAAPLQGKVAAVDAYEAFRQDVSSTRGTTTGLLDTDHPLLSEGIVDIQQMLEALATFWSDYHVGFVRFCKTYATNAVSAK